MYNFKNYECSDAAQPAYKYRGNGWVNPAFPSEINIISDVTMAQENPELMDALKHRLKRAKKSNNQKKIRAIKAMLKKIHSESHDW